MSLPSFALTVIVDSPAITTAAPATAGVMFTLTMSSPAAAFRARLVLPLNEIVSNPSMVTRPRAVASAVAGSLTSVMAFAEPLPFTIRSVAAAVSMIGSQVFEEDVHILASTGMLQPPFIRLQARRELRGERRTAAEIALHNQRVLADAAVVGNRQPIDQLRVRQIDDKLIVAVTQLDTEAVHSAYAPPSHCRCCSST